MSEATSAPCPLSVHTCVDTIDDLYSPRTVRTDAKSVHGCTLNFFAMSATWKPRICPSPMPHIVPDLRPYFIALDELPLPCDPQNLFETKQPLEVDIGCGRGLFLFNASTRTPRVNFLGIEIDYKEGRRGAQRLKKLAQPNARVIGGDAKKALAQYFPSESLHKVHVYFPDPWWKTKHHKRRLFTSEFVELVYRVLVPDGELHLWTDVTDYWAMVRETMAPLTVFFEGEPPTERDPEHDLDFQTSFERKKRQAGWPIYRGMWRCVKSESGFRSIVGGEIPMTDV